MTRIRKSNNQNKEDKNAHLEGKEIKGTWTNKPPTINGKAVVWAGPRNPRKVKIDEIEPLRPGEKRKKCGKFTAVDRKVKYGAQTKSQKRKVYDDVLVSPWPAKAPGSSSFKLGDQAKTPYIYLGNTKVENQTEAKPAFILVNPERKEEPKKRAEKVEKLKPRPPKILGVACQRRVALAYIEALKNGECEPWDPLNLSAKQERDAKKSVAKYRKMQAEQDAEYDAYVADYHRRHGEEVGGGKVGGGEVGGGKVGGGRGSSRSRSNKTAE